MDISDGKWANVGWLCIIVNGPFLHLKMNLEISGRPWGPSLPSFPQLSKKVFRGFPHSKHRAEAKDHEASIATKPQLSQWLQIAAV